MIPRFIRPAFVTPAVFLLLAATAIAPRSAAAQAAKQAADARNGEKDEAPAGPTGPGVQLVGADTVFQVRGEQFRGVLTLEVPGDSAVRLLRVDAPPLTGAFGSEAEVTVATDPPLAGGGVALAPRSRMRVRLSARLDAPGDYRGHVAFVTGRGREVVFYRVSWGTAPTRALEVKAPGAVEKQMFLGLDRFGDVAIPITVHDSTRMPVQIYEPTLVSLTRAGPGDTAVDATHAAAAKCDGELVVKPNGTLRCSLTLKNISRPGRYSGQVRVAGPDVAAVTLPVVLYVRLSWFWAVVFIALGVGLAEWLRRYMRVRRPQLVRLRKTHRLLDEAQAAASRPGVTAAETEVLSSLRAALAALADAHDLGTSATADARLAEIDAKLELLPGWAALRGRVEALRAPAPGSAGDAGEARPELSEVSGKLEEVRIYLLAKGSTEEERKKAQETLDGIPALIDTALAARMKATIDAFLAEVKAEGELRASDAALLKLLQDEVEARATAASQDAGAGRLASAREKFEEARATYARLLAADLDSRLEAEDQPGWMKAPAWEMFARQVRAHLARVTAASTPRAALDAYAEARKAYVRDLAQALRAHVQNRIADTGLSKEHRALFKAVDGVLDEARRQANLGNLREASRSLEDAQTKYREAEEAVAQAAAEAETGGGMMGGGDSRIVIRTAVEDAAAAAGSPALPGDVPDSPGYADAPVDTGARRRTQAYFTGRIRGGDWAVSAIAAAVAIVLGLNLLWVDAPTWGSFKDVVAAFLWGLGLHKVGSDAFGGLAALVAPYGASAPAASTAAEERDAGD